MPDPAHDDAHDRLAELQRVAYGSGGSDADRAAAADELARLRAEREDAASAEHHATASHETDAPAERDLVEASARAESRAHRRIAGIAALASGVGLLVGLLGGWQLAMAVVDSRPRAGTVAALTDEDRLAALQWQPVEQTAAFRALQREASADDRLESWGTADWAAGMLDPETVRRLAATSEVQAFGARSADHEELCLLLVIRGEPFSFTCTEHGVFPVQGMTLSMGHRDTSGAQLQLEVTWRPDGTLRLMTPLR